MTSPEETPEPVHLACGDCGTRLDISDFEPLDSIVCPFCTHEMLVPGSLDHFRLTRLLGQGSMGRVYLGLDETLNRPVAVKVLRKRFVSTPRMWTQLEKEAKAAAGINSPHVVQIYRLGNANGRPYIVMELIEHDGLENRMHADEPIPENEILRIGIEVMRGLKAAQAIGLVHGDIKPANILMNAKGRVKVADFGLARFAEKEGKVEVWGTPYYIAPEKALRIQEDFRSDMYSLGATLFHALAGQAPFEAEDSETVMALAQSEPTPDVRAFRPDIGASAAAVIARMMHKEPDQRFASYDEAIEALAAVREGRAPPPAPPHPPASPGWIQRWLSGRRDTA